MNSEFQIQSKFTDADGELGELKQSPPAALSHGEDVAPLWFRKGVYFFRLGLALFLAVSCWLGLTGCSASNPASWHSATKDYSSEAIATLIKTYTTEANPTKEQIDRAQALPLGDRVVALNLGASEVCGSSGCLHLVYDKPTDKAKSLPDKALLSVYLRPDLPPKTPLLRLTDQTLNDYPCLQLHQVESTTLKRYTLCKSGETYSVTNQVDVVPKDD